MVGQPHHNPPSSIDERLIHLICQAQSSDISTRNRAQERLIRNHESYFRKFASGLSQNEAEEVRQSARVGFILSIPYFDSTKGIQLKTYARSAIRQEIGRNACANLGLEDPEKLKRYEEQQQENSDGIEPVPVWTSSNITSDGNEVDWAELVPDRQAEEAFAVANKQMEVRQFVAGLSAIQQAVYHLLYVEQKTQADAARILNLSQPRINQLDKAIKCAGRTALAHLVAAA
jgi:RNA polymerase sigma factor (sigma-70 family)